MKVGRVCLTSSLYTAPSSTGEFGSESPALLTLPVCHPTWLSGERAPRVPPPPPPPPASHSSPDICPPTSWVPNIPSPPPPPSPSPTTPPPCCCSICAPASAWDACAPETGLPQMNARWCSSSASRSSVASSRNVMFSASSSTVRPCRRVISPTPPFVYGLLNTGGVCVFPSIISPRSNGESPSALGDVAVPFPPSS